jgi:hypothetical protein
MKTARNFFYTVINVVFVLTALLSVSGCSRKNDSAFGAAAKYSRAAGAYPEAPMAEPMFMGNSRDYGLERERNEKQAFEEDSGSPETGDITDMARKLVKRAFIRVRVENLEAADAVIADLMTRYGAYAASTEIAENSRYYSLRVPAPEYDAFLGAMNGIGRMLHRSENTEDVTLRYYDLDGRLTTKKELLKTFQSYLGKAGSIEDILSVEARIAELQNDIEGTGMQLRHLANMVDYTTIDLNLLGPMTSMPNQGTTFGERIQGLLRNFGHFLSTIAVVLVGIVMYGVPVLLLLVFFFWILFGRIGLMKKLWRIVNKKQR